MTFIERIAARFGFQRVPAPTIELIVFPDYESAREAGFRTPIHPTDPNLRAWWPSCGVSGLMMRPVRRVTVSREMTRHFTVEGPLYAILRKRQMVFGDQAMWVEL